MNQMNRHLSLVILDQFKIVYLVLSGFPKTQKKKSIDNGYVSTFDKKRGFSFILEDLLEMMQYLF